MTKPRAVVPKGCPNVCITCGRRLRHRRMHSRCGECRALHARTRGALTKGRPTEASDEDLPTAELERRLSKPLVRRLSPEDIWSQPGTPGYSWGED